MASDVPWIAAIEARRDATIARIAKQVGDDVALAHEKTAALAWCRANGNPHLAEQKDAAQ